MANSLGLHHVLDQPIQVSSIRLISLRLPGPCFNPLCLRLGYALFRRWSREFLMLNHDGVLPTSSIAIGFKTVRGCQRGKARGADPCKSGEFMNHVGLIYIALLRSRVSPVAGSLFAGGYQRGLEPSDPRQGLR